MRIPSNILRFVSANAPTIMTAVAVAGVFTTAVLTGKASVEAHEAVQTKQTDLGRKLEKKEFFKLCWPYFVPPVLSAAATVTSVIGASTTLNKRNAALLSLYGAADTALTEYKSKMVEILGEKKAGEVTSAVSKDRIDRKEQGSEVLIVGSGEALFHDSMSGRYFFSTVDKLQAIRNEINAEVIHQNYVFLNKLYSDVGLSTTVLGDQVGWNYDRMLEFEFIPIMSADNKPCLDVVYRVTPSPYNIH